MAPWNERVIAGLRHPALVGLTGQPDVWVVGGAVRDVLLGRTPREIDLVVEGDAVALARRMGRPDAVHERFGTARVGDLDFAAARTETYAAPGALPDVRLGATIEEDLARRDFSVNALAVRLSDGAGAAWPGALEDLEAGLLRILHEGSFVDDPTRVLRLVRYGVRLGFTPEPETARLAAGADLGTVSGDRLGAEVRLLLGEPLPEALVALEANDLGRRVIHPAFRADRGLLARVVAAVPTGAEPGLAALGACLLDAADDGLRAALDRLAFPATERDIVLAAAGARPLADALRDAERPSAIADAARRRPSEALAVAAALGAEVPVRRWLDDLRHVRLAISGDDLLAAGLTGPAVGAGLRAALAAALDGTAPGRAQQLETALHAVQ